MLINDRSMRSPHSAHRALAWLAQTMDRLTHSASDVTLAHVETSAQGRARLQSDLQSIDRWLAAAVPGTERYRQLTAERRRILLALGRSR